MFWIGLFQILVPLLLMAALSVPRHPDRLRWALTAAAFGLVVGFMWIAARWDIVTLHYRTVLPVLFAVAGLVGYRRIRAPETQPTRLQTILGAGINLILVVIMTGLCWAALIGYSMPDNAVDLASPLRERRFVIGHGGASPFINAHFRVRSQSYALDILGLNALGMRADLFGDRRDLESYEIFAANIYSPCAGLIGGAVDRYPDLVPPAMDSDHLAGNYVLVACQGVEVVLAHMKRGSVRVAVGDAVTTGTILGQVGNTGNSSEPHLHIHAERGGATGVVLDGRSVPITIDGRFLVRGDVLAPSLRR